ncbi:helix-turn-helix domain-containing protein [Aneurinibacillus aneurinilyticus]|uniref:helix-turn-helix domain-containing protein n=1 Tax=Aneurinibacillus aneurinilyticus TaxID=1391 RepID=UPI003524CEA8
MIVLAKMTLGERIKYLREKNGYAQKFIAEKIGVKNNTLSSYESDKRQPDYDTLQKIADFFEVSTDYLLGRTDEPSPTHKASNDESDGLAFIDGKGPITEEEKEYLKESLELFRRMKAKKKE